MDLTSGLGRKRVLMTIGLLRLGLIPCLLIRSLGNLRRFLGGLVLWMRCRLLGIQVVGPRRVGLGLVGVRLGWVGPVGLGWLGSLWLGPGLGPGVGRRRLPLRKLLLGGVLKLPPGRGPVVLLGRRWVGAAGRTKRTVSISGRCSLRRMPSPLLGVTFSPRLRSLATTSTRTTSPL